MDLRRASSRFLLLLAGLLLFVLAVALPSAAKDRHLKKFDSEIVVLPNGTVDVTESITMEFVGGPWHGINRFIPVEYTGPRGLNYSLFLDVKSITDESGTTLKYDTSRSVTISISKSIFRTPTTAHGPSPFATPSPTP